MGDRRREGGARRSRSAAPAQSVNDVAVALLIEAGAVLATSLEPSTTMGQVARLTVPRLADLCVIDLRDEQGLIRDVAVASADSLIGRRLEEMRGRHPVEESGTHPVARVIRTGRPELLAEMGEEQMRSFATSQAHADFMVASRYRTAMVAPLAARNRTLGAISLLRLAEGAPYTRAELELTCELARRAALAIDNARLYSHLSSVEQRMEAILVGLAEAVTVIDRQGRTIFANRAAMDLLGVEAVDELAGAAPGTTMDRFIVLDERGRELTLEQMPGRRLLQGEDPQPLLVRNISKETGEERWLMVRASPVLDAEGGDALYAVNVFEDITEIKRAQIAERFLAEAGRALASSLEHPGTLERIARLAVPTLADMCAVSLLDERGEIVPTVIHHVDPAKLALARELECVHPLHGEDPSGFADALSGGHAIHAEVRSDVPTGAAHRFSRNDMLRRLGMTSVILVPMTAGGRALGAITLASGSTGRRLTPLDIGLAEELGRRAGIAVENERLYTERSRIASALQQALLPHALPRIPHLQLQARYAAAGELNEVGGDFYDVFEHADGRWVLAIGDVCGKGPRAAAVTALARHTLRAAAAGRQSPRAMLTSVHQALTHQPVGLDMCTLGVVLADIRPPGARLTIALGGHPHPLLIDRNGGVQPVGRPGTLLGVIEPLRIEETEMEMGAGETLLLHTDGVSEAGAPDRPLGEQGLIELCALAPRLELGDLLSSIARSAIGRAGGSMRDDIALLACRTPPDASEAGQ